MDLPVMLLVKRAMRVPLQIPEHHRDQRRVLLVPLVCIRWLRTWRRVLHAVPVNGAVPLVSHRTTIATSAVPVNGVLPLVSHRMMLAMVLVVLVNGVLPLVLRQTAHAMVCAVLGNGPIL